MMKIRGQLAEVVVILRVCDGGITVCRTCVCVCVCVCVCCFVLYDNKQRPGTGITYFILCILCHEIKQLTPEHNKINKTTLFLQIVKQFASKNNKNASK